MNEKSAIIFARVSTEEQMTEGLSIPAQIKKMRDYAKDQKLKIIKEFQVSESSTKKNRKEFEELIKFIKKDRGFKVLIVETVDRLQRDFRASIVLQGFLAQGVLEIHFLREGMHINKDSKSFEFMQWDMGVMFARSYVLQLSDNVKRSFQHKRENGEFPHQAPIGCRNMVDDKGKKTIGPDGMKAHLIKRMFEIYVEGTFSYRSLADEMYSLGLAAKNGKPLSQQTVKKILNNPFYYGYMRIKGELIEHRYDKIISKQLYNKVQLTIKNKGNKASKGKKVAFASFRGIMKCAECRSTITPELKKGVYVYYCCRCRKGKGSTISEKNTLLPQIVNLLKSLKVEDINVEEVVELVNSHIKGENKFHFNEITRLKGALTKIENRIENLRDNFFDKNIDESTFAYDTKRYEAERVNISSQLKEITLNSDVVLLDGKTAKDMLSKIIEIFNNANPSDKRQLINFMLKDIKLDGDRLIYGIRKPFEDLIA